MLRPPALTHRRGCASSLACERVCEWAPFDASMRRASLGANFRTLMHASLEAPFVAALYSPPPSLASQPAACLLLST
eukprot:6178892-Pleurochrysis_carterae.AAC.1